MKTMTKGISIEKGLKVARPFIGSMAGKSFTRPVLKTALVNEKYIVATDSHRLIRIQHDKGHNAGESFLSYLHHYSDKTAAYTMPSSYPQTDRLFPDPYGAKMEIKINVQELIAAHSELFPLVSVHANKTILLNTDNKLVAPTIETYVEKGKGRQKDTVRQHVNFERAAGAIDLKNKINVPESVQYNCKYMSDMLKAFKQLKQDEVILYFYGQHRPLLFKSEYVECLILPIRTF